MKLTAALLTAGALMLSFVPQAWAGLAPISCMETEAFGNTQQEEAKVLYQRGVGLYQTAQRTSNPAIRLRLLDAAWFEFQEMRQKLNEGSGCIRMQSIGDINVVLRAEKAWKDNTSE